MQPPLNPGPKARTVRQRFLAKTHRKGFEHHLRRQHRCWGKVLDFEDYRARAGVEKLGCSQVAELIDHRLNGRGERSGPWH